METKTDPTLVQVAEQAFEAFEFASGEALNLYLSEGWRRQVASRRDRAADVLFAITGFNVFTENGRADTVLALAVMGCPSAQAILDAEFAG